MARPLRPQFSGAVYHLTARGNARQPIVLDDEDRRAFLRALAESIGRFHWICHAYCLMDNHYHLVIETPQPTLSRGMRQLNGVYTQRFNRRHERIGHLFQGRFKAILAERDAYLLELSRYVVLNPVRAGMVESPDRWPWSSYAATAGLASAPAWLSVEWLLRQFAPERGAAQEAYRRFVAEGTARHAPWSKLRGQIYLGSDAFCNQFADPRPLPDVPRQHRQPVRPSLSALIERGVDPGPKLVAAYVTYGYGLREIAKALGVHPTTISRWLRSRLEEPTLRGRIRGLLSAEGPSGVHPPIRI